MAKCLNRSHPHQAHPVSRQLLQATSPSLHQQRKVTRSRTRAFRAAAGAEVATPGPVLVADGVVVPAPATAQQLLSEHPGWSYTAALVKQQYHVIDWDLHIERLLRCVAIGACMCWVHLGRRQKAVSPKASVMHAAAANS
jgi:hypothetical protein